MFKRQLRNSADRRLYKEVLLKKHPYCHYCPAKLTKETATIDHYLPKLTHPHLRFNKDNFVLSCQPCNSRKSGMHPELFMELLEREGMELQPQFCYEVLV
jgi:5-methylcytosine-specific restriction endonuclease McrA